MGRSRGVHRGVSLVVRVRAWLVNAVLAHKPLARVDAGANLVVDALGQEVLALRNHEAARVLSRQKHISWLPWRVPPNSPAFPYI